MGRKVVQHRIFDLALLLLLLAVATTMRLSLWPSAGESVENVATPIGTLLQAWQEHIPILSTIIWAVVLFCVGLGVGRLGVRYSIYPAYTLMGIPLFGVVAGAIMGSSDFLLTAVAALVMFLATKYMVRFVMRSERFNDLSLAMLCFGILPLIYAPLSPFYLVLPVLTLFVRGSWRDLVVSLASLLLPPFALCYWSWCAGEGFIAHATGLYSGLFIGSEFNLFGTLNFATIALLGIIIMMIASALALLVSDKYAIKSKSRVVLRFNTMLIVLLLVMFLFPSASATHFAIMAIPVAMLVPLFFVRMGMGITELSYRLMLLAAAINIVLLAF